jgi:hypothetical protein
MLTLLKAMAEQLTSMHEMVYALNARAEAPRADTPTMSPPAPSAVNEAPQVATTRPPFGRALHALIASLATVAVGTVLYLYML